LQCVIHYNLSFLDGQQRAIIKAAMQEFHDKTCVKFRPWTGRQPHFVSIENRKTGCWSALGRIGGKQRLNLQTPGCTYQVNNGGLTKIMYLQKRDTCNNCVLATIKYLQQ
jgi:hypothetical protein